MMNGATILRPALSSSCCSFFPHTIRFWYCASRVKSSRVGAHRTRFKTDILLDYDFFADKKYLWCALVASIAHHWKACLCFSLYRFFLLAFNFFFHLISQTWWSGFDVFSFFYLDLKLFFYFVDGCERHKWIISV